MICTDVTTQFWKQIKCVLAFVYLTTNLGNFTEINFSTHRYLKLTSDHEVGPRENITL